MWSSDAIQVELAIGDSIGGETNVKGQGTSGGVQDGYSED